MKPTRTVKTADTLLSVINNLQHLDGGGVTELAEHLGLAKSTVHDHLATLREHGYVVKDGNTYHLSLQFLDHGTYARDRLTMREAIEQPIQRLAEDTQEMIWFTVEENGEIVHLFRAVGRSGIDLICRPGTRVPIHATAAGKVVLASYSNKRIREIANERKLTRQTPNTVTEIDALLNDIEAVREESVAITRGENYPGVASVAAGVSVSGQTVGAVDVSGPAQRFSGDRLDEIKAALLGTINEIELRLSHDVCP